MNSSLKCITSGEMYFLKTCFIKIGKLFHSLLIKQQKYIFYFNHKHPKSKYFFFNEESFHMQVILIPKQRNI